MKNGGLPPQPTFRSIFGGIALLVILILAFLNLGITSLNISGQH